MSVHKRFLLIVALTVIAFLVAAANVIRIQVVQADEIIAKSQKNYYKKIILPARRGDIEDRTGDKLAITRHYKKVCASPRLVSESDLEKTAKIIAELTGADVAEIIEKLDRDTTYVELVNGVDLETAVAIAEKRLNGIWLEDDFRRIYPYDNLACQVIGFVGRDIDPETGQPKGMEGLEYYYNDLLSGTPGYEIAQYYYGNVMIPGTLQQHVEAYDGLNLRVSIDREIQYIAEKELKKCIEEQEAQGGTVIVMDSQTGEIYAAASCPDFNLNEFNRVEDQNCYLSLAYRAIYEPGSTIKPITVAGAIEEGIFAPDSVLHLPEKIEVGGYRIGESHHRPEGDYTVTDILVHSYNVGAVKIAEKLGKERLYEYLYNFGLGQKTQIDVTGEQPGLLSPPEQWHASTFANIPFGQGISVTPLQVLRAINVFATGGYLIQPHFMLFAYGESGSRVEWEPSYRKKVISEQTCRIMTDLLVKVVEEGTGQKAQIKGYTVAGKTGTAQVPGEGGYKKDAFVSSFVGFVPANNPKLTAIVVIREPKKEHYGGSVAGPVFSRVCEFALRHLGVPPDKEEVKSDTGKE